VIDTYRRQEICVGLQVRALRFQPAWKFWLFHVKR